LLQVEGIDVFYGAFQALWGVSFEVQGGELVAIVGSNGAGKTTILKTISGLLHARAGKITFLGESIGDLPPHRIVELGIAHIPEGRELFSALTVMENLRMGSYLPKAKKARQESLDWVFSLFPVLEERKDQLAGTLSGGEQQMLAIARGLMSKPELLLLDEPSLGLAPKIVLTVFEIIKKLNQEGLTILVVEQHIQHILGIAHRAYLLETGRIALTGSGKDLLGNDYVREAYLGL